MRAVALSRVGLTAAVALACVTAVAALVTSAQAGGGEPLRPDLVTLEIARSDLGLERDGKRTLLRLSNEVANSGSGPLEVFPSPASADCDGDGDPLNDRDASQRTFEDSNGSSAFERGTDGIASERLFGCMRFHAAHNHWHVLDFAHYELRRERSGRLAALSRKVGFCLVDSRLAVQVPGASPVGAYPFGPPGSKGCDDRATQGLSPGYADLYAYALAGQQLDVSGLRRGRYCLSSEADPSDVLAESDEGNNVRRVRLALRPWRLELRKLEGPCKLDG